MADAVVSCVSKTPWECNGYTRLMNASRNGNIEDVKNFIAQGDPLDVLSNEQDQSTVSSNDYFKGVAGKPLRNTALLIAIYNANFTSNFSVANILINAGANVRIANSDGDTAMHYMMQRIYRRGIFDLTHTNQPHTQATPNDKVATTGNTTSVLNSFPTLSQREDLMVNLIAHGADINAQNNKGYTMLHVSVLDNEGQWIQTLSKKYGSIVDFNVKAYPISCQTLTGFLGAPKANVSDNTCQCLTPIQLAGLEAGMCTGNTNVRDYFLNNPPIILGANQRDTMGMTGLMLAVIWEGTQKLKNPAYSPTLDAHKDFTVDKLLQETNDLNAAIECPTSRCEPPYNSKNTVLHIALLHQLPDMVIKILESAKALKKNINVNQPNIGDQTERIGGDTPLHYVLKLNALTLPANAHPGLDLNGYNNESRNKVIQALINAGGNINIQNYSGDTVLHLAVKAHATDLVNFILQTYNTINLKPNELINLSISNFDGLAQGNPRGKTALELAQELNFVDIATMIQAATQENQQLLINPKGVQPTA